MDQSCGFSYNSCEWVIGFGTKPFPRWGDVLFHGKELTLLRRQGHDLINNAFSLSFHSCRSQSEFSSCMLGNKEKQFPLHPFCCLLLTVWYKTKGWYFFLPVSVTKVTTKFRIACNTDSLACLESITLPCSSPHMFHHMELFNVNLLLCSVAVRSWGGCLGGWAAPLSCPHSAGD